ncbi:MAG: SOS response-associated peptidase, partial [Tepidisphaeraceae bacterium]
MTTDPALLAARLDAIDETTAPAEETWEPNYNVAPTSPISTLVSRHPRETDRRPGHPPACGPCAGVCSPRRPRPRPTGSPTGGPLLINARAETVTTSPAFRTAARRKRCLVPMDGWYEWRGPKGDKIPFYLYAADGQPLLMAGLWSVWHPPVEDTSPIGAVGFCGVSPLTLAIRCCVVVFVCVCVLFCLFCFVVLFCYGFVLICCFVLFFVVFVFVFLFVCFFFFCLCVCVLFV